MWVDQSWNARSITPFLSDCAVMTACNQWRSYAPCTRVGKCVRRPCVYNYMCVFLLVAGNSCHIVCTYLACPTISIILATPLVHYSMENATLMDSHNSTIDAEIGLDHSCNRGGWAPERGDQPKGVWRRS